MAKDDDEDEDKKPSEDKKPALSTRSTSAPATSTKASKTTEEDDEDEDEDDVDDPEDEASDDDDDDDVDEPVAAKPAPAKTLPLDPAPAAKKPLPAKTVPIEPKAKAAAAPPADPPPPPVQVRPVTPPAPAASLGKSVTAFMFILVLLMAGFWFLGTAESPFGKPGVPKWKINQTVAITLTLDPRDDENLACASSEDIGGKFCEFKSKTEKNAGAKDELTTLRPYKTTADEPLLAAGVWSSPDVAKGKRPNGRFNLKCQFKVEAKVPRPLVRWRATDNWGEQEQDWFAGTVQNCVVDK